MDVCWFVQNIRGWQQSVVPDIWDPLLRSVQKGSELSLPTPPASDRLSETARGSQKGARKSSLAALTPLSRPHPPQELVTELFC